MGSTIKILRNESAELVIDLFGGAITSFHLHDGKINPLSFRFSKLQMPVNNRKGAPFQGHFVCLGRWGEPSAGEIKGGVPDHGHIANILWEEGQESIRRLKMEATSVLEGLYIERTIMMDGINPIYWVHETITNINPLGRLYNMVQHPTISAPFLNKDTIINCNAESGFNYNFFRNPMESASIWPQGITDEKSIIDIRSSANGCSSVFSFIVKNEAPLGWITAYSPKYQLLFGYLWKRKDYPWLNLWQDWEESEIRYRGLEFGTTGIHKPFHQILDEGNGKVFGENTFSYIDSGQKVSRSYLSFLHRVQPDFAGIENINISNDIIEIDSCQSNSDIIYLQRILNESISINGFLEHLNSI